MRPLERQRERLAGGGPGGQPRDVGGGDHHVTRLLAGEVEHVVQELLLGARDHAARLGLVDQRAQLVGAADGVARDDVAHAERPQEPLRGALQDPDDRAQDLGHQLDRRRHPDREPLRAVERERLRHQLAEHDREVGDDAEGDDEPGPVGQPVAEQAAHERLADRAGEDAERGDPDLHGGDHADGVAHQAQRGARARMPVLRHGRDRAAARRHDRVLADDEEGVPADEGEDGEDAEEIGQRGPPDDSGG